MVRMHARARRDMKNRVAAVLLLAGAMLNSVGWTEQAWGQSTLPRVGILSFKVANDPEWDLIWMAPFRRELAVQGWIEGKTVSFEFRSALSDPSQFAKAAIELVELKVDVIVAPAAPAVRAA